MKLIALDHFLMAIPAGGEDRARQFYGGLLGLTEIAKPEALVSRGGCWFNGPGFQLHLGVEADFKAARKAHPAFRVANLALARQELEGAGFPVKDDTTLPDVARFFSTDPFGNRIEFIQG